MVSGSECLSNVADYKAVTIDVNWQEQKTFTERSFSFGVPVQRYFMCKSLVFRNQILGIFQNLAPLYV